MTVIRRILLGCCLVFLSCNINADQVELRVATAANFRHALLALKPILEGGNMKLTIISASTGSLFQQILRGAPFDLFLAADSFRPIALEANSMIASNSRRTYAYGRLVLWSREQGVDPKSLLTDPGSRIALADPRLAPYGRAARESLESLQLWELVEERLVWGRNINQAFLFAVSGQAQVALVSAAQVALYRKNNNQGGSVWYIPNNHYSPIEQQVVVLARSAHPKSAWVFAERLLSKEAQALIAQLGYISNDTNFYP